MAALRCQLNVYAHIATKLSMGSVSGLALLYYEPVTEYW